ncbi:hypothetical protein V5N11_003215 [Cardamine amara subsp. amara]|uniref:Uncharacterized protein n=1 Tax=Cardamine amara subsp. amara TaxID=228776 RepID=A0ABD0Z0E7_CARAN
MVKQSQAAQHRCPHYGDTFLGGESSTRPGSSSTRPRSSSTDEIQTFFSSGRDTVPETLQTQTPPLGGSTPSVGGSSTAAAPPQPPPPPPGVHPDLAVPPDAPYAQYTVEDLLVQPGQDGLPKLDPNRPPNTFGFGVDSKFGHSVSDTIKRYFTEPHPNVSRKSGDGSVASTRG